MGVLGDTLTEFKSAKPTEKIFIVGGVIAVLGVAWYIHSQNAANASPAQAATGASSSLQGNGATPAGGGIQTVPTASGGSVPILPPGLIPIFDSSGNLLGYQPTSGSNPTTTVTSTAPTPPKATGGPLIASGQYKGPSFSNLKPNTYYNYGGTNYLLSTGGGGRLYGQANGQGNKQLLYGPPSSYPKQGGGPYGTRVLSHRSTRIAPTAITRKQSGTAARVYAMRNRQ
jgi:hypothetical protein